MLKVVRNLVCKDTVALARMLLQEAVSGEVREIAVCFRRRTGPEEVRFTGSYLTRPHNAVAAAGHMYWIASEQARLEERAYER